LAVWKRWRRRIGTSVLDDLFGGVCADFLEYVGGQAVVEMEDQRSVYARMRLTLRERWRFP